MADDTRLKSAFELAMERLQKKDEAAGIVNRPLTDAEKTAIAEVRNYYEAKIAEQQVLYESHVKKVTDPAAREALDSEWRRERERFIEDRDRKIDKIRSGH
jgi:hypothetical protein